MLHVERITRQFGALMAVNTVSFEAGAGEIVAILGENGAGKSTLLSCIAGFIAPDAGTITIDGKKLRSGEPGEALRHGIGTAFQHSSLVPMFTVAESFALAGLASSDWEQRLKARRIRPNERIRDLGVAERQQLEFLKARLLGRKVLLLDEPTSPLAQIDVERVLEDIASAAADGATVLFVTHRLREALAVADRILVMRHGFNVGEWSRAGDRWDAALETELLSAMFGSRVQTPDATSPVLKDERTSGAIVTTDLNGGMRIELSRGCVHAIVGVAGNGQRRLVQTLAGERPAQVELQTAGGGAAAHDAGWLRSHGTIIPEDRIEEGGALEMALGETLVLRDLAQRRTQREGWVSRTGLRKRAEAMIANWSISPAEPSARFGNLSGGNMQRTILARALDPEPELLTAVNPTQGLDVATAEVVRERLRDAAEGGAAVVSYEQDVDDALRFADHISVMFQGQLSAPVPRDRIDRQRLQLMMVAGW